MSSIEKGISLFEGEQYQQAIAVFSTIIKSSAEHLAYYHRAMSYLRMSQLDKAMADFESAIKLNPKNAHYISQKAVVLLLMGRKSESMDLFDLALSIEPQNPYRYSSRAYAKESLGDTQGAIQDYKRCIELDPTDAIAHNNLGLLEEKLGYYAKPRFEMADKLAAEEEFDTQSFIKATKEQADKDKKNAQKRIIEISEGNNKKRKPTYFTLITDALFTAEGRRDFWAFVKKTLFGK